MSTAASSLHAADLLSIPRARLCALPPGRKKPGTREGSRRPPVILPTRFAALFNEDVTEGSAKAYRSDLKHFIEWCRHHGENPLSCSSTALVHFLTEHAEGFSMATVERRAAAISWAHRKAGFLGEDNPRTVAVVVECFRLLRRRYRDTKQKQARELSTELARALVDECRVDKNTTQGLRDRALLLIGFSGAFRRSELVRICVADLEWRTQGVEINVRWSKTDQEGKGLVKYIPRGQVPVTDPVGLGAGRARSKEVCCYDLARKSAIEDSGRSSGVHSHRLPYR